MPKIRKLKRSKRFRVNVNRKRMRNKLRKLPDIECKQIKEAWEGRASVVQNLQEMGLAYDPNKILGVPNFKKKMLKCFKEGTEVDEEESESEEVVKGKPKKAYVAESLEKEAKWPRAKLFRLPNSEVMFATYMMDKYGDDYKAMERDRKNYYQLTWRQIRQKIQKFKSIPEQYAEYLVQKGEIVLDDPTPLKKIKPQDILREPVEKKSEPKKLSRRKRKKASLLQVVQNEEIGEEDDMDFDTSKTLDDDAVDSEGNKLNKEKKLQLFSDDENDDEDDDLGDDDEDDDDDDDDDDESMDDGSDDDEDDEDDSNSEDQSDGEIKIVESKASNIKNNKTKKPAIKTQIKKDSNNKMKKSVGKSQTNSNSLKKQSKKLKVR